MSNKDLRRVEKTAPPAYVDGAEDLLKGWSPDSGSFDHIKEPLKKGCGAKLSKAELYKACVTKAKADGKADPEGYCKMEMEKVEKAELRGPQQHKMGDRTYRNSPDQEAGDVLGVVRRKAREKLQEKMGQAKETAVYAKSEGLDKAIEKMRDMADSFEKSRNEGIRGVQKPMFETRAKDIGPGKAWSRSPEGTSVSRGLKEMGKPGEKESHKRVLRELRSMPKPDLPKSESVEKTLQFSKATPMPGQSYKDMGKEEKDMTVEDSKNLSQSPNWNSKKVMPMIHPERRDEASSALKQRK